MCGRYSIILTAAEIAEVFGLSRPGFTTVPRYNLAPTDVAPVIVAESGKMMLTESRFGLIPFWNKGDTSGAGFINARAETLAEKPAFRRAFARSRCLVPADGFYEWKGGAGGKTPYRIVMPDLRPFAFAGLCDTWSAPDGQVIHSFAIITTSASDDIAGLHHRMPVILDTPQEMSAWLTAPETASASVLLRPYEGRLKTYPVSKLINSVKNDGPECIVPVELPVEPGPQRLF